VMAPYIESIPVAPIPIVPPVVPQPTVRPSGGWPAEEFRRAISGRGRLKKASTKAIQIIEEVAARQAERLEADKQRQLEELSRELELAKVKWEARYLRALNAKREMLIDAEIQRLMKQKMDEEALLLIILAATL